jgi:valyl-tRNA synthetase
MQKELAKIYEPKEVEDRIYRLWLEGGYFHSEPDETKEPFTIVIPPPNVTGQLHMGHALDETLQDILIRYKRMKGFCTLWLPGTDHAGIATQIKVEEALRKEEGKTRHDLGREKFLEKVWDWKNHYGNRIIDQLKKLGSSCDWERERFTMDEGCSKAVKEVFVNLYNKGLIYRGNRIINWCPECTTALSDAEVDYTEKDGNFWYIKYPVKDSEEFLVVATTRPETMLGDTAVAVNPDDKRFKHLVGKTILLPLMNREIPIVADDYVDIAFGTGCVKITPCHDPNDFELGKRHHLEEILVMDGNAKINENGGKYKGLSRYDARKQIVDDLTELGLLVKIEPIKHNVGQCYRCNNTVEPITSSQWFVKMKPLADEAIEVVNDGTIKFIPDRFSKIYLNWMENVHDWCISRQLWWGHRIPAFYCDDCGEMTVSKEEITVCPKCTSKNIRQDEDVLDTWFSSALWPFSTLGWPDETADLKYFYPTSVLVTAYDIIFFWVARMIFSGMEHMKQEPFKYAFIHGLVRDAEGRKMSKSLGNGIDPLEIIDAYGADALRFTLATGNSPGNDMRFSAEKVESSRNFANKIWNATRFALMNLNIEKCTLPENPLLEDKWILSKFNTLVKEVTENIDKYEIGIAVAKLYDFIWDNLCDWYIELIKPRLFESNLDKESNLAAQNTLCYVLSNTMKLLHPIMPFITEEIWQTLPHEGESVMVSSFPEYKKELEFKKAEEDMERIMTAIKAIRNCRAEMNVPPSKKAHLYIETDFKDSFTSGALFFNRLAGASDIEIVHNFSLDGTVTIVSDGAKLYIPFGELVDIAKETERLNKEKGNLLAEIDRIDKKLSNEGFVSKAPEKIINEEKEKRAKYHDMLTKVEEAIANLNK